MVSPSFKRRLLSIIQTLAIAAGALFPLAAEADDGVLLELRPHCDKDGEDLENLFGGPMPDSEYMTELAEDGKCFSFPEKDETRRQTAILEAGEELDMDLVILNPDRKPVSRVRGWIAYDPDALEVTEVELSSSFPIPTPGEEEVDEENGVIKIGASAQGPASAAIIKVARVKVTVKSPIVSDSTMLSFDRVTDDADSKAAVVTQENGEERNILSEDSQSLVVRLSFEGAGSSSSVDAGSSSSEARSSDPVSSQQGGESSMASDGEGMSSTASSVPVSTTAFTLLQVLNLRATTEGSSVFLAWDALEAPDLRGYNVYYGTTSGRYIQRRSVDSASTTLTLRGLVEGTTYYIAVRGVNGKNQESQFSREVGITVGQPETSTSPLAASAINNGPGGQAPGNGGTIAGESGSSSLFLIVFGACALIGTAFAFKRQLITHG